MGSADEPPKKTREAFEVGLVYAKNSVLYLAVAARALLTAKRGRFRVVRPQRLGSYERWPGVPVDELCGRWGITVEDLDRKSQDFFRPSSEGIKFPPYGGRGNRRSRILLTANEDWQRFRRARIRHDPA